MHIVKSEGIRWIQVENYHEMSHLAAGIFEQQILKKSDSVLGFATGRSPEGFYQSLVKRYKEGDFSFEKAVTFNLDEYVGLGPEDETSYHNYMKKFLFDYIDIPVSHRHLPNGLADNLTLECQLYEQEIEKNGGIDLQLLGIGVNGHIGFNEPGTSLQSKTHVVELAESTRRNNSKYFPSEENVPTKAITMGLKTIMKAKQIILIAFGADKIEAIERLKSGHISEDFPASILNLHPDVTVFYGK